MTEDTNGLSGDQIARLSVAMRRCIPPDDVPTGEAWRVWADRLARDPDFAAMLAEVASELATVLVPVEGSDWVQASRVRAALARHTSAAAGAPPPDRLPVPECWSYGCTREGGVKSEAWGGYLCATHAVSGPDPTPRAD